MIDGRGESRGGPAFRPPWKHAGEAPPFNRESCSLLVLPPLRTAHIEMRTTGSLLTLLLAVVRACEVTVYSDNYFDTPGSREATFRDGEYNYWKFIETMENDAVSSLKVEGHNCVAVLYGGPSFDGWSATFHQGRYDLHAALAKGLIDNEASSLKVGYGQGAGRARPQPCTQPQPQRHPHPQPLPKPPSSKPSLNPSPSSY